MPDRHRLIGASLELSRYRVWVHKMPRQNFVHQLFRLRWSVTASLAIGVFVIFTFIVPYLPIVNPILNAFSVAAEAMALPISGTLCVISLMSFVASRVRRYRRIQIFNKQTGEESISRISWQEFESLVAEYFSRDGYDVYENTKKGADDGVDLRLMRDGKMYIVQCKHWKASIGVSVLRELLGTVTALGVDAGILATSSTLTRSAKSFALANNIVLIDKHVLSDFFNSRL